MIRKRCFKLSPTKHFHQIHCLVFFFFASASFAQAENVTLIWQPSDPPADTYRIFQRTSGETYDYSEWIYQGFETTCVIPDLAPNTTYYFVVRAYSYDSESEDSNEVSYTTVTYTPDYQDNEIYTPDYQAHETGTSAVFNNREDPYEIHHVPDVEPRRGIHN
jgi:hypothetical protein